MLSTIEDIHQTIRKTVDKQSESLYAFISRYIQFQTVNPKLTEDLEAVHHIQQCQQWLMDQMRGFGCFDEILTPLVDPMQPNIVGVRRGTGDGRGLFFNGHTDVVPVTEQQKRNWRSQDPWSGEIFDDRIWGRGASDMKGANAAFVWALKVLNDLGIRLKGDCAVTLVVGEETGDREIGIGVVMDQSRLPNTGIIAEATELKIAPATMGEFYFCVRILGRSCTLGQRHQAIYPTPYGQEIPGFNAIDMMRRIQDRLAELERQWGLHRKHPLMIPGSMSINISKINGGDTYSAMAGYCEIVGSVLYAPNLSFEEVSSEFRQAIQQVVDGDYWMKMNPPEVVIPYFIPNKPANNLPVDHPLCVTLEGVRRELLSDDSSSFSCPSSATNDGNYMVNRGFETVTFGTRGFGIHGTNENVLCEDILTITKIYALSLLEWCEWSDE